MKISALFLPFVLALTLFAQDKQYVDIPGAPVAGKPIWATTVGNDAVFAVGEKTIALENLDFKKPFFGGDWEIRFKPNNHTERELEEVVLQVWFYSKDNELLTDPNRVVTFTIDKLPTYSYLTRTITVAKGLWPDRHKDVAGLKMLLISFKAPKSFYEKMMEEDKQRKIEAEERRAKMEEEWAAKRAKIEAEATERRQKYEAEEAAKKSKQQKAAAIAKKKRDEDIARQPAEVQEMIRKRQIRIGMTKEQVILAWGRPQDINTTTSAYGSHEQWVYGLKSYVYFDGGRVTTIQN